MDDGDFLDPPPPYSTPGGASISSLPTKLVRQLATYVNTRDLASLGLTCRHLSTILYDQTLWRSRSRTGEYVIPFGPPLPLPAPPHSRSGFVVSDTRPIMLDQGVSGPPGGGWPDDIVDIQFGSSYFDYGFVLAQDARGGLWRGRYDTNDYWDTTRQPFPPLERVPLPFNVALFAIRGSGCTAIVDTTGLAWELWPFCFAILVRAPGELRQLCRNFVSISTGMYTLGLTAEGNLFMWTTPYDELKPGFDKTKRVCRTPMPKRFGCTHPVEPLVGRGLEPNVTRLERIPGNGDHRVVSITQGENVIIALTADGELWTLRQGSFGRVIGEWEHLPHFSDPANTQVVAARYVHPGAVYGIPVTEKGKKSFNFAVYAPGRGVKLCYFNETLKGSKAPDTGDLLYPVMLKGLDDDNIGEITSLQLEDGRGILATSQGTVYTWGSEDANLGGEVHENDTQTTARRVVLPPDLPPDEMGAEPFVFAVGSSRGIPWALALRPIPPSLMPDRRVPNVAVAPPVYHHPDKGKQRAGIRGLATRVVNTLGTRVRQNSVAGTSRASIGGYDD